MSDGSRLHQTWYNALNDAETHFRQLLTSSSSAEWKRLSATTDSPSNKKGKGRASAMPELGDVVVHRKPNKASGGDVYRLVLDVPTGDDSVSLEPWKSVLTTPELRQEWDPAVEDAHLIETFDHSTRICKTNFTLGWPANPRDSVTIARSFHDASTFIDISTSLPRSADEPAYLRPSPPYVRSHVTLFAWCIQHLAPPPQLPPTPGEQPQRKRTSSGGRLRITCFWQHDLRTAWNIGSSSSNILQQLSTMGIGLFKTVMKRGSRIPKLTGYGNGVSIERIRFQIDREALTIDYAIIPEEEEHVASGQGIGELHAMREQRRLKRSIECVLPSDEGWDVRVSTKASSEEVEKLPWNMRAIRSSSFPATTVQSLPLDQIVIRLTHAPLIDEHSLLKVRVVVERSGPSSGLRLNGLPQTIQEIEERDPSSYFISQQILQDASSTADLSFDTTPSIRTGSSSVASTSSSPSIPRPPTERTANAEKSILSRVRRNYIYFSSLLQEPEAKWRRTTDARGVSITQLDSIDPTLVVYRAEATFVGVGLWDLYSAVVSPGAQMNWDKSHEDAVLLEDVNDLTELWHLKTKPAWPANGRDSVVLKTVYKSPSTIHVFSFSADDPHLFPNIPPADPNVIRTQIDLRGWAIETLSPTTTLLTLLEQSDPKGWTNKTSIPTLMINALAGIGEFAIKHGGPPVVTRLAGAKTNDMRYDHDRLSFKVEYEASASRQSSDTSTNSIGSAGLPVIECELRCDMDTWAPSLDIVVDPPPQSISCLRRHRLSTDGGGLWLTLTHDAMFVDDERLLVLVRRSPGKEKGLVMINGAKVNVDVEELQDSEIKSLTKQKRVKPARIPLDQPPVVGVIRRRRAEWDADSEESANSDSSARSMGWATAPRMSSPLARFFTYAVDQTTSTTQQAIAAISPASGDAAPSPSKQPMQYVLEALAWVQQSHNNNSSEGWLPLNDKALSIRRKLCAEISPVIQIHKGEKVIEGVSAEELAAIVTEPECRKKWDERFDSATVLESYGADSRTSFVVAKAGFPFRDRGFYVASILARAHVSPSRRLNGDVAEQSNGPRNAIFCVSASFSPDSAASFSPAKYNPYGLPIGRIFVDAWILETLDPYTKENYAIPSTRCTYMVALDYAGSVPAAFNSMINASAPRSILSIEAYFKSISSLPITRLPPAGLVVSEKEMSTHEPFAVTSWKVRRRDEHHVLAHTKYLPDERVYTSTILLTTHALPVRTLSPSPSALADQTPRPSRLPLSPSDTLEGLPNSTSDSALSSTSTVTGLPSIPSSTSLQLPMPLTRERAGSASSVTSSPRSQSTASSPSSRPRTESMKGPFRERTLSTTSELRGRTSSAFTIKGEVRMPTDLLVAELVVDSKLYPEGYSVALRSQLRADVAVGAKRQYIPLSTTGSGGERTQHDALPLAITIHTMPSSPLHSSGLRAEAPTRHLLKLTLPTAQYQISTVKDPLTDEMRGAPPKPPWLLSLDEGGAVVEIEVRPGGKKGSSVVVVDGKEVPVVNEKEALTTLGREELLDDRISKMSVLSRSQNEPEMLSEQLSTPVAVADNLLDAGTLSAVPASGENSKELRENNNAEGAEETVGTPQTDTPPPTAVIQQTGSNRLLEFMTRLTGSTPTAGSSPSSPSATSVSPGRSGRKLPGGLADIDAPHEPSTRTTPVYPLSTVVIIALIAFLIGSLFRSLLSPADFIYVVRELGEDEEAKGWREIRRLIEVKRLAWGYDVHLALGAHCSFLPTTTMATVAPQGPLPGAQTPQQDAASNPPLSWEGDKMFNIYIYDYCYKRGFRNTARELLREAEIPSDSTPPINARQGLLFEWWSVFWVLFTAKANGNGTDDAMLYTHHQAAQAAMKSTQNRASAPQPLPGSGLMGHGQPQLGGRPVNGMPPRFAPNGIIPNGIPQSNAQPPGPTAFAGGPPGMQPNGIIPGAPGMGQQPGFMPGQPRPPIPGQPRLANGGPPFQSPTMAHSPPHSGPSQPGQLQHGAQPPMSQLGPPRGMLPPGPQPGMNPGQQTPTPYQGLAGRPPSRTSTPQGMMNPSPSMAPRQPMVPGSDLQNPTALHNELAAIPANTVNILKGELGLGDKNINTLTLPDKARIIAMHRQRMAKPGPPGPSNATAGPSMPGPSQQQRRTNNKRNSTSPGEDQTQPDDIRNGSSPPDRKRPRRSPMEPPMPNPSISPYPQHPNQPPLPQAGGSGGPGGPPPGMGGGGLMHRPMGGPIGGFPGPGGQPMQPGMQQMPGSMGMMGGGMNPMGMAQAGMSPQMHPQPTMMQYRQHNFQPGPGHPANRLSMGGGPMNAGSPGSDPSFNPGVPMLHGGPSGGAPGQQPQPGQPPQQQFGAPGNRLSVSGPPNQGPKPPMSMLPPPSPAKDQNKDTKPPNGLADVSPRNQPLPNPNAPGTAPPTPNSTPQQPPGPQGGNSMAPSPGLMMNPNVSTGAMNSVGMPLPPSATPTDTIFNSDFMQNMEDFVSDVGLFRGDGDLNFERDFGQWFNPDDVGMDLAKQ
ncbi:hypothetical protein R3P38DRAFT_2701217 [Favolaschia claudopus]|uniref:START domain-containing protein n=1 Tax=Favolaschia claudopus TaxID=2862362 RepID=A0AAW0BX49_9AGAR